MRMYPDSPQPVLDVPDDFRGDRSTLDWTSRVEGRLNRMHDYWERADVRPPPAVPAYSLPAPLQIYIPSPPPASPPPGRGSPSYEDFERVGFLFFLYI